MDSTQQQHRFAEWTRDHSAILYRVVNGFASGDDRHDLLQEVLLAVWKSIPSFRGQAKPSTFLYRVCHNAALVWIRSARNYQRRIEQYSEAFFNSHDPAPDPILEARLDQLYAAIRELSPADRSLILLSLDGLSYREMAEILGLSESNVGVKLNRIKTRLTQTLKGNSHEPQ